MRPVTPACSSGCVAHAGGCKGALSHRLCGVQAQDVYGVASMQEGKWDEARAEGLARMDAEDSAAAATGAEAAEADAAPAAAEGGAAVPAAAAEEDPADPFGLARHISSSPKTESRHTSSAPLPLAACSKEVLVWCLPVPITNLSVRLLQPERASRVSFTGGNACRDAGMVWSGVEVQAVRRQALLEGLEVMRRQCWQPWARSAAHLALAAAKQHRARFLDAQQERLQALIDFLRTSKASGIVRSCPPPPLPQNSAYMRCVCSELRRVAAVRLLQEPSYGSGMWVWAALSAQAAA